MILKQETMRKYGGYISGFYILTIYIYAVYVRRAFFDGVLTDLILNSMGFKVCVSGFLFDK